MQYSCPSFTNTGESNVYVVAVDASVDVFMSAACKSFLPNGKIFGPGYPFITFLNSIQTG